jgi:hypothetical protein
MRTAASMSAVLALLSGVLVSPAARAEESWVNEARGIATAVPQRLLAVLTQEIEQGGPAHAVDACQIQAPQMARKASETTGWQVRRVTLRERNPKAVPDAWERAALEDFDRRAAAGESPATLERAERVVENGQPVYRYVRALPVQAVCLNCHGAAERQSPELRERLRTLYPDDKAVGYELGQIRGVVTLRKNAP